MNKIVSNYVLMDLPDPKGAVQSFYRVLKPGGFAVIIISHPCFPQSDFTQLKKDGTVQYKWDFSYFEKKEFKENPWKHFSSKFIWYHRPLSRYFRVFKATGFILSNFDEPVVQDPPPSEYNKGSQELKSDRMRPNSVIFLFKKPIKG